MNLKYIPSYIVNFVVKGLYFGYPECCIDEFVRSFIDGFAVKCKRRKFNGTGFVPCAACNKKSKKEILAYIKSHRQCKLPFPQQPKPGEMFSELKTATR